MKRARAAGFTLIELLVVIAIIMILAGFVLVGAPRVLERAKIASLMNVCNQIRVSCVGYATKPGGGNRDSFPPAYGYADWSPSKEFAPCLVPYMQRLGYFRNLKMYDPFAMDSHDTDRGGISLLEFSPMGRKQGVDTYAFPTELYNGSNLKDEVDEQLTQQRPMIYIPVNSEQAKRVATYYYTLAFGGMSGREQDGLYAKRWLPDEPLTDNGKPKANPLSKPSYLTFPPRKYDDFVLISVGPGGNTGGLLAEPKDFMKDVNDYIASQSAGKDPKKLLCEVYHILGLRAYYLATRDYDRDSKNGITGNGNADFDFRGRTRKQGDQQFPLPDGTPGGQGPFIYHASGG